jgi:hypothetical protein
MGVLDRSYLVHGLDALSRACEMDYFADGHRGAAIVAAHFLCRENDVEQRAADVIAEMIDAHWTQTPLCEPFPDEEARPELVGRIVESLDRSVGRLREVGHNVIFASLALKAIRRMPEAATPARIEGICKLIDAFKSLEYGTDPGSVIMPSLDDQAAVAEFVLAEYLEAVERFDGRGQGWAGHLLTYGRAMIDLAELGYGETAEMGLDAFKQYVARLRLGPHDTDTLRPEHARSDLLPTQAEYWEKRRDGPVAIGHLFKYPYGFYGHLGRARDRDLIDRCLSQAHRVL